MKKIASLLLLTILMTIFSSCAPKGRGYRHVMLEDFVKYIDEYNFYCDDYYITIIRDSNNSIAKFNIYNNDNMVVDCFVLPNNFINKTLLCENVIYIFQFSLEQATAKCYYKKIGSKENILEQIVEINEPTSFVNINKETFYIDYFVSGKNSYGFSVCKVGYNEIQENCRTNFYTSLEDSSQLYGLAIDDKEIHIQQHNSENRYIYKISKEIMDAKYIFGNNSVIDEWSFGCDNSEDIEASKGTYSILNKTTKLMDDGNLYFAYGRYLGEFEKCDCFAYGDCILSNRICEILRFNTTKKEIERVALIPETYTVLSIYEDCAIIMNNERIGTYYYDTQEITDIIEVDIAGEIFKTEYEWPDINAVKFYFKDKKIEKYVPYKSNNLSLNSYSNILFVK